MAPLKLVAFLYLRRAFRRPFFKALNWDRGIKENEEYQEFLHYRSY